MKIWLGCDSLICITAKQNDFKQAPPKLGSLAHEIYVRNMEEREERERQKASAERYCQAFELVPLKEKVAHCRFFIEKFTKEVRSSTRMPPSPPQLSPSARHLAVCPCRWTRCSC